MHLQDSNSKQSISQKQTPRDQSPNLKSTENSGPNQLQIDEKSYYYTNQKNKGLQSMDLREKLYKNRYSSQCSQEQNKSSQYLQANTFNYMDSSNKLAKNLSNFTTNLIQKDYKTSQLQAQKQKMFNQADFIKKLGKNKIQQSEISHLNQSDEKSINFNKTQSLSTFLRLSQNKSPQRQLMQDHRACTPIKFYLDEKQNIQYKDFSSLQQQDNKLIKNENGSNKKLIDYSQDHFYRTNSHSKCFGFDASPGQTQKVVIPKIKLNLDQLKQNKSPIRVDKSSEYYVSNFNTKDSHKQETTRDKLSFGLYPQNNPVKLQLSSQKSKENIRLSIDQSQPIKSLKQLSLSSQKSQGKLGRTQKVNVGSKSANKKPLASRENSQNKLNTINRKELIKDNYKSSSSYFTQSNLQEKNKLTVISKPFKDQVRDHQRKILTEMQLIQNDLRKLSTSQSRSQLRQYQTEQKNQQIDNDIQLTNLIFKQNSKDAYLDEFDQNELRLDQYLTSSDSQIEKYGNKVMIDLSSDNDSENDIQIKSKSQNRYQYSNRDKCQDLFQFMMQSFKELQDKEKNENVQELERNENFKMTFNEQNLELKTNNDQNLRSLQEELEGLQNEESNDKRQRILSADFSTQSQHQQNIKLDQDLEKNISINKDSNFHIQKLNFYHNMDSDQTSAQMSPQSQNQDLLNHNIALKFQESSHELQLSNRKKKLNESLENNQIQGFHGGAKKWLQVIKRNKNKLNIDRFNHNDINDQAGHYVATHCLNKQKIDSIISSALSGSDESFSSYVASFLSSQKSSRKQSQAFNNNNIIKKANQSRIDYTNLPLQYSQNKSDEFNKIIYYDPIQTIVVYGFWLTFWNYILDVCQKHLKKETCQ
eukprot:403343047